MARPKVNIDWKKVDKFLEADCEGTEIAAYLGINPNTLYFRCKEDHKVSFSEYLQEKKARGNSLLKVKQFDTAMSGDKTMMIWLGKQRLGQKEKQDIEHTIKDELPFNIKLEYRNRKEDNSQ